MKKIILNRESLAAVLILGILVAQVFYFPAYLVFAEGELEANLEQTAIASTTLPAAETATSTISVSTSTPELVLDAAATSTATSTEETASSTEETASSTQTQNIDEETASTTPEEVSQESDVSIVSGEAIALANILNLVNTNSINSNGAIVFSNFFDFVTNTLDLRDTSGSLFGGNCADAGGNSGLSLCSGESYSINLSDDASIENQIFISALTGRNLILGGATSTIETGDAYAGLNLINIANTSFVDSDYLLVTLNAFKDVEGDVVFPSLTNFFDKLAQGSPSSIQVSNSAEVENNVSAGAETGDNEVSTESGSITTGTSTASSNVFNQINTTVAGGANVSILFRIHGSWAGEVFGAPENLGWTKGPDGSVYLFDTSAPTGPASSTAGSANMQGLNSSFIRNNVSVIALTGENEITGGKAGLISTGNAYAGVNLVNIANSNIIGRNWIMAIVNIFGDFKGNIAFGRPDLWVGEQVEAPAEVTEGATLNYKFSVINNGDSSATKVKLVDEHDPGKIEITDSSVPYERNEGGQLVWNVGTLPAGMATEISYSARVRVDSDSEITNIVSVSSRETDNNNSDNTDTATVRTKAKSVARMGSHRRSSSGAAAGQVLGATIEKLSLTITRSSPFIVLKEKKETVHQELVVKNPNDTTAKEVKIRDILKDPQGTVIHQEEWDFGDVLPNEEITVTYDLEFKEEAEPGFYNLSTKLRGLNAVPLNIETNGLIYLPGATIQSAVATEVPQAEVAVYITEENEDEYQTIVAVPDAVAAAFPAGETEEKNDYFSIVALLSVIPVIFAKLVQVIREVV